MSTDMSTDMGIPASNPTTTGMNKLYQLRDVEKSYTVGTRPGKGFFSGRTPLLLKALDGIRLDLDEGDSLAIVGESGSGKSTLVRLMLGLEAATDGRMFYQGKELASLAGPQRQAFTREVAFIYQDARGSMNPRLRVRDVLAEPMLLHKLCTDAQVDAKVAELLTRVGLSPDMADRYPAELSGGQVRRVAVARALAVQPKVIFADESVAGLDVSVQAQLLNLLCDLCRDMGLTLVFITHDLGVASYLCSRIAVMYLGRVVEEGPSAEILARPHHPYTRSLLRAFPSFDRPLTASLTGEIPSPINLPPGCRFASRCPDAREACRLTDPSLAQVTPSSSVACLFPLNVEREEALVPPSQFS